MTQWQHLVTLINQLNANTDGGWLGVFLLILGGGAGCLAHIFWTGRKKYKLGTSPTVISAIISIGCIIWGIGAGINGIIEQYRYQRLEPEVIQQLKRVDYHHAYLAQSAGEIRIIVNPQRMTPASAQHALVIRRSWWDGKLTTEHVVSTPLANATVVKATPQRIIHALVERK